jgi:hypothetical protein
MNLLPPAKAAELAEGVYGVNQNPLASAEARSLLLNCEPEFSLQWPRGGGASPFARSASGALPGGVGLLDQGFGGRLGEAFSPVASDFGYVAMGNGDWAGHMVIVTRGTMGAMGTSADWISNYNVGLQPGPGGRLVHAGFNTIWAGFNSFVRDAVTAYAPRHIHCVGHSLGGALANLNALMLARGGQDVALYSFGAPRVGALDFATELTARLSGRAKRVYHPADPVPMIPLLPFLHAPLNGGIRLAVPAGSLIDADAHNMRNSYRALVGRQDWGTLENATTLLGDFQIDSWLQRAARQRGGVIMRSAALLERIAAGLARLIARAAIYVIGSGLSAAVTATLTSLDFIAWLLARAAALADELREQITGLVNAIFGFLGRVGDSIVRLTQRALRWVLNLLYDHLSSVARRAFDRLR